MRRKWEQARLTASDVRVIVWVLVAQALARGYDYLIGVDSQPTAAGIPLWVWGGAFFLGGLILAAGLGLRVHTLVWAGHAWLWVSHLGLFVEAALNAFTSPWLDGIRGATVYLLTTTIHCFLMVRTGIKPLSPPEETVVEEGISRPREGGE